MSAGLLCAYGASRYDTSGISDRTLARARGFPLIGARTCHSGNSNDNRL